MLILYSVFVWQVGSFEHNLTTDLLNHLVFVQKVFMKEVNEVIQKVSGKMSWFLILQNIQQVFILIGIWQCINVWVFYLGTLSNSFSGCLTYKFFCLLLLSCIIYGLIIYKLNKAPFAFPYSPKSLVFVC